MCRIFSVASSVCCILPFLWFKFALVLTKMYILVGGGALERRSQGRDSKSKSDTEKGTDDLKPPASPLVAEVAVDLTKKEKKKKGEGSKDKGAVIQKRKSTGAEPAANHNRNLKDGSGKIKRLKFSNRQELIDRQEQTALPTDTVERKVYQRGGSKASGNGSVKLVGVSKAAKTDNVVEFLASTNVLRENEGMLSALLHHMYRHIES